MRLCWPFFGFADGNDRPLPWVAMAGPVRSPGERAQLDEVRRHHRLLGFTCYLEFPRYACAAHELNRADLCEAWCHCFRAPEQILPPDKPRFLLAYSDFTDPCFVDPDRLCGPADGGKDHDFVYVCLPGAWCERAKNWALARRCVAVLCNELGLRGLLVGRAQLDDPPACGDRLTWCGQLAFPELMRRFRRARMVLVAGGPDPSPRVLAEALAMDTPVLVQRDICGGWHYVNPFTGVWFTDETDVADAARRCLEVSRSPRRWFASHHGPRHAGARLASWLRTIDPSLGALRQVRLAFELADPAAPAGAP